MLSLQSAQILLASCWLMHLLALLLVMFEELVCQICHDYYATAIPSRKYSFSSDQESQTRLGSISTRLSDRPGTLSAVVFLCGSGVN